MDLKWFLQWFSVKMNFPLPSYSWIQLKLNYGIWSYLNSAFHSLCKSVILRLSSSSNSTSSNGWMHSLQRNKKRWRLIRKNLPFLNMKAWIFLIKEDIAHRIRSISDSLNLVQISLPSFISSFWRDTCAIITSKMLLSFSKCYSEDSH